MNTNDIATPPRKSVPKSRERPRNALANLLSEEDAVRNGSEIIKSKQREVEKLDLDVNEHNATANEAEDQVSEEFVCKTPKVHKHRRITGIKHGTPLLSKISEVAVEKTDAPVKRKLFD